MVQNLKRTFTAAVIFVFALTLFAVNPAVVSAAGSVSSFGVSQSVFDPDTETIDIDFTLSESGKITLEILDNNAPIETLAFTYGVVPGDYSYTWDGTDRDGNKVAEKEYEIQLLYYGSDFALFESSFIKVDYADGGITTSSDLITNVYATPTSFDSSVGEDTDIHFTLSENADVIVKIETTSGVLVKSLLSDNKNTGSYYSTWDGRNWAGGIVSEGTYQYIITADNGNGETDSETGIIQVVDNGGTSGTIPVITADSANPSPFDPNEENTTINFTLNTQSDVTIKIYDGASVINTIRDNSTMTAGSHSVTWDGRDSSNNIVDEGSYTYNVLAENEHGFDAETGSITVDYETVIVDDDVFITNAYTSPSEFDPSEGEETIIHYDLNTCAYVTITVYDKSSGVYIDTLETNDYQCSGSHQENWDGRDDDYDIVANGEYEIKVHAENPDGSSEDTEIEIVTVDDDFVSYDDPQITNVDVDPYTFDPSDNEESELTYRLNTCADVTVRVYDNDNDLVITLKDDEYQCEGTYRTDWDGEDRYNDEVSDGIYYFKITAVNDDGSDTETVFTRVDLDGYNGDDDDDPEITSVDVEDESFDPYDDYTRLSFRLNTCADVTIEVRDEDNDTVREILEDRYLCGGAHSYVWNGKDDSHDYVREDDYEFYIYATNSEGSDSERIDVEVNYDGHTVTDEDRCAGFIDVDERDPYCTAIEYVEEEGIFDGYSDGSFRPYIAINRTETVKVVLEGFDYPERYSTINFWDVSTYEWYYDYLRTAVYHGIIEGYPDGSFRPAQTVNRVELLKVFLESSNVYVPACYSTPYADVPSNEWYTKYVCFAKSYDLMDADYFNNFNPAKPMTRGDVAELFYRFSQRDFDYSYDGGTSYDYDDDPEISSMYLSDYSIDRGDSVRIYYTLSESADVTVEIINDDREIIRTLINDLSRTSGSHSVTWDAEDDDSRDVIDGEYTVCIEARNDDGYDRDEVNVEIGDESDGDLEITSFSLNYDEFDPYDQTLRITFRTNERADITIKVYDDDDDEIRELWDGITKSAGSYTILWDGEDDDGDQVYDGDYTVEIIVDNADGYDKDELEVRIDS